MEARERPDRAEALAQRRQEILDDIANTPGFLDQIKESFLSEERGEPSVPLRELQKRRATNA